MSSPIISDRQVISRLLWKEFRQVRWLALFVLCLGILAHAFSFTMTFDEMSSELSLPYSHVATLVAALFAIGCGATLFAGEHDNHTYLFQRMLPASRWQILGTKMGLMVGLTAALFTLFWLVALADQWMVGNGVDFYFQTILSALFVSEMLMWSVFFSVVDKRPAYAICKAVLGETFVLVSANAFVMTFVGNPLAQEYWAAAIRGIVLVGLTLATVRSTNLWYISGQNPAARRSISSFLISWIHFDSVRSSTVASLIWLQMRTASGAMLMVGVIAVLLYRVDIPAGESGYYLAVAALPAGYLGVLIGLIGMRGLMTHRSLMMQMGVRPIVIWASQVILPIVILVVANLVILSVGYAVFSDAEMMSSQAWAARWLCSLGGLALGMYCALLARAFLINLILATISSTAVTCWLFSIQHLDTSLVRGGVFTALVIVISCTASVLLLPGCLKVDRTDRVGFWATVGVRRGVVGLILCWGLCLTSFAAIRVYEVPYVSDHEIAALLPKRTPDTFGRQKADMEFFLGELRAFSVVLQDAVVQYGTTAVRDRVRQQVRDDQTKWMKTKLSWLATLDPSVLQFRLDSYSITYPTGLGQLKAGLRAVVIQAIEQSDSLTGLQGLQLWIQSQMRFRIDADELIFDWANLLTTESESIQELIATLQAVDPLQAAAFDLERQYVHVKWNYESGNGIAKQLFLFNLPWESYREHRIINTGTKEVLRNYDLMKTSLDKQEPTAKYQRWEKGFEYTLFRNSHPLGSHWHYRFQQILFDDQLRRAMIIRLAIIAWRKDHQGQLPSSLEMLQGDYLSELPVDPITGESFIYFPNGIRLSKAEIPYDHGFRFRRTPEQAAANRTNPCLYSHTYKTPRAEMLWNPTHQDPSPVNSECQFFELIADGGLKETDVKSAVDPADSVSRFPKKPHRKQDK